MMEQKCERINSGLSTISKDVLRTHVLDAAERTGIEILDAFQRRRHGGNVASHFDERLLAVFEKVTAAWRCVRH
jgi:hypothetical protein